MSQDFRIAHSCPHLVVEERVSLESDRRGLSTKQPLGLSSQVRITANDELILPKDGLFASARLQGRISGPFRITQNENDITIENSSGSVSNITIPTGYRVSTDDVVLRIASTLESGGLDVAAEKLNGTIALTDFDGVGPSSYLRVSGAAADALGFDLQTGARGSEVFPGWSVEKRSGTEDRFPRFNRPIKNNPVFKVTYVAPGSRCLRCGATFVENDYRFDRSGEPILISNEDLLVQAAQKIVLTKRRSNRFHTWYGTDIHEKVGLKMVGNVSAGLREEVEKALRKFQQVQNLQGKAQSVSNSERLFNIVSVEIRNTGDPTFVDIDTVLANASGRTVSLSIVFTVPGAVALAGSNNQSLGLGV